MSLFVTVHLDYESQLRHRSCLSHITLELATVNIYHNAFNIKNLYEVNCDGLSTCIVPLMILFLDFEKRK